MKEYATFSITDKIELIINTMEVLDRLSHFDFMSSEEVEKDFLDISKAIIDSDIDIIYEIIDSLEEDDDLISDEKLFNQADRNLYSEVIDRLRDLTEE